MQATGQQTSQATFFVPILSYPYDALEPFIDARTMEIHHDKHHDAYVANLNKAIAGTNIEKLNIEEILKNVSKYPASFRNNAGGHYNHSLFWTIMSPQGKRAPSGKLAEAIHSTFGSFEEFKTKFAAAATERFGSGWAWLIKNSSGNPEITSTPNQDNPLMDVAETKGYPILGLDVWEHAYYLKYQNKRADYINAWWNVVNWQEVEKRFTS